MRAVYLVAAVVAITLAGIDARGVGTFEEHPIDWYNCTGVNDGNYPSPRRCTEFISCSGGVASQRECPVCNVDPVNCPDGQLIYDPSSDSCEWANEATCSIGNQTTSTEAPRPISSSEGPRSSSSEVPSSPDAPPSTVNPERPPQEGDPCDEAGCKNTGYCDTYLQCVDGVLVNQTCGVGLVWNERGEGLIHGGNCDRFENLDQDLQDKLRKDRACLRCYWEEISDCSQTYRYQAPNLTWRNVSILSCADDLVFSEAQETCVRCQDKIDRKTGNACC